MEITIIKPVGENGEFEQKYIITIKEKGEKQIHLISSKTMTPNEYFYKALCEFIQQHPYKKARVERLVTGFDCLCFVQANNELMHTGCVDPIKFFEYQDNLIKEQNEIPQYNAILFAPDGEFVRDFFDNEDIEEVWEKINNMGSRWVFYPICAVEHTPTKRIMDTGGDMLKAIDNLQFPISIQDFQLFLKRNENEIKELIQL